MENRAAENRNMDYLFGHIVKELMMTGEVVYGDTIISRAYDDLNRC